jgi:hypothetical protein
MIHRRLAAALLAATLQIPSHAAENTVAIRIEPHPRNPPDQNQYIAFNIHASWLDGYIRVRFPENVNSSLGLHFLDNLEPARKRVSTVTPPEWKTDPKDGSIFYQVDTAEGVGFSGRARVEGEVIHMNFTISNHSGRPLDLTSQVCFDMSPAAALNRRGVLETTHTWIDGSYRSLSTATSPNAAAKFKSLGYNWVLMLYNERPDDPMRRIEPDCAWWILDQKPDHPLLARETRDGSHLVAISWGEGSVRRLMSNTSIPCLHADPLEVSGLPDGRSRTWCGRIFMTRNQPAELLRIYQAKQ